MGIFSRLAPNQGTPAPRPHGAAPSNSQPDEATLARQQEMQRRREAMLQARASEQAANAKPAAHAVAPMPQAEASAPPHVRAVNAATRAHAALAELTFSDLMLWPDGRGLLRHVAGEQGPIVAVPAAYRADVEAIWAAINQVERGREFFLSHDNVPYRVARIETIQGPGYFLRRPRFPVPALDTLGLPPAMVQTLRALGSQSGMVLMAGATGSGKSTTIYSYLTDVVTRQGDIAVAVEDPPELPAQGVYGDRGQGLWYQIDANAVGGFETAMIAAMRYNPRYVMLGEIRAPKVANEAIRAAVNGHLVLTTIHGNSLSGAILALQQIAAAGAGSQDLARSILADGLAAVIHQKLQPDPQRPGQRRLVAEMLCIGQDMGLRAKIRAGKLEQLTTEIEAQALRIARGQALVEH